MGRLRGVTGHSKVSRNGKWAHSEGSLETLKFQGITLRRFARNAKVSRNGKWAHLEKGR